MTKEEHWSNNPCNTSDALKVINELVVTKENTIKEIKSMYSGITLLKISVWK